ncbi:site-specific integrase [Azospirillum canadense]|uniref:site-specific integrase n=1 Tax=Azospirillum canadense TaxID=403962 RepID=UPI002226E904|nr:site-specific integrase [Azospirillum canadense]MCW2243171.1 integrase [Azospirillum canadense]
MAAHTGLQRRTGGVYYLRLRVPADLRDLVGRKEIVKSLRTRDLPTAKSLLRQEMRALDDAYQALRGGGLPAEPPPATSPSAEATDAPLLRIDALTGADIGRITTLTYHVILELDAMIRRDPDPEAQRLRRSYDKDRHAAAIARAEQDLRAGRLASAADLATVLLRELGCTVDGSTDGYAELARRVQTVVIECARIVQSRAVGDWSRGVENEEVRTALANYPLIPKPATPATSIPLAAPSAEAPPRVTVPSPSAEHLLAGLRKVLTLDQLVKLYIAAHPQWSGPTAKTYQMPLRAVREVIGDQRPVDRISRDACREVLRILSDLPSNYTKRPETRGLSMTDAARVARDHGLPRLATKTVNAYMNNLSALFNWATDEQYMASNPARKLSAGSSGRSRRKPFTTDHLITIFRAPLYCGCKDDRDGYAEPGPFRERRGRFWVPLLALWGGLRLNEACQLDTTDVVEVDGILGLHIHAEGPLNDKHLKTAAAHRFVPVHPELDRLGFRDFVRTTRAAGAIKLFPDLPRGRGGYYSEPFSKWFGRFLDKCGLDDPSLTHHSFRHSFRDALREAEVLREVVKALGGWEREGTDELYGSGYSVRVLFAAMAKIRYGALDLSHLYV